MRTPPRTALIETLFEHIHRMKRCMFTSLAPLFETHGITHTEWYTLSFIREHPRCPIKDVARALGATSSAATQVVNTLAKKGWIERHTSQHDRRTSELSPTKNGNKLLAKIDVEHQKIFHSLFEPLSTSELATFADMQRRILTHSTTI